MYTHSPTNTHLQMGTPTPPGFNGGVHCCPTSEQYRTNCLIHKGRVEPPTLPPHKHAAHAYTLCQMQLYKGLALCCYHTCTSIPQSHSHYSHHSPTTEYIGIPGNLKGFTAAVGELIRHEGSRALNYLLVLHCPVQWGLTAPTPSSLPSSITREITCLAHCLWHYFAH